MGRYFIILVCVALYSCRKDPDINISYPIDTTMIDTCSLFPKYEGTMGGYTLLQDTIVTKMPYFNPNNDQELVYVRQNYSEGETTINKYNLLTKTVDVIFTGEVRSRPKWGASDWIIFTSSDENIYKVKSDGTSLTQLTFTGGYHYPEFNFSGDSLIAMYEFKTNNSYVFDLDGNIVDSISFDMDNNSSWGQIGYLVTYNYAQINVIDIYNNSLISTYTTPSGSPYMSNVNWVNENEIIWGEQSRIYRSDILFGNPFQIDQRCGSSFNNCSISGSGLSLIWENYEYEYLDLEHLNIHVGILLMDLSDYSTSILELP